MLAFTHFFASTLAFHLADTAGLWPWKTAEQEELCLVYEQQAFLAANEQIRVAESLLRFSGFKVSSQPPSLITCSIFLTSTQGPHLLANNLNQLRRIRRKEEQRNN